MSAKNDMVKSYGVHSIPHKVLFSKTFTQSDGLLLISRFPLSKKKLKIRIRGIAYSTYAAITLQSLQLRCGNSAGLPSTQYNLT